MRRPKLLLLALPLLLASVACRVEPVEPGGGAPAPRLTGNRQADESSLQRLEREARDLARTEGCSAVEQCRTLPVGAKACGGPRYHLPYCPLSTDVDALERKLAQLERFERSFNERYGIVSTCDLAMPPRLELSGGACRVAGSVGTGEE